MRVVSKNTNELKTSAISYLSPSARCAPVNGLAGCYVSSIGKPREYFDLTGFAFDAEILYLAKRFGYRVSELPVPWSDSIPSRVHAVWHSLQMLKELMKIRLLGATGAYESVRAKKRFTPESRKITKFLDLPFQNRLGHPSMPP